MNLQLEGLRAVVTGASMGIGRATAETLAEEGCDLLLVARNAATLGRATDDIGSRSRGNVACIALDLADEANRRRLVGEAGDVDILVNCAGAIPAGSLTSLSDESWRASWELKVFGYIGLCRLIYPKMAARRTGVIINILGAAGERPDPNYIAGSTGNAGLIGFTRALGKAATRDGLRVVGINPGFTLTDRARSLLRSRAVTEFNDADRWPELQAQLPFARAAAPEEIGAAVAFLASSRSGYTSGTVLTIDGGAG